MKNFSIEDNIRKKRLQNEEKKSFSLISIENPLKIIRRRLIEYLGIGTYSNKDKALFYKFFLQRYLPGFFCDDVQTISLQQTAATLYLLRGFF